MIIVLGDSVKQSAERYSAVLAGIGFDPTRFRDLADDDLRFCHDFAHSKVLWLTLQMDRLDHTDDEREAAIARALASDAEVLGCRSEVAMRRLHAGETPALRDFAAFWVSECAIKNQLEFEMQRRTARMH